MKHHETLVIRCYDTGARCGEVGARRSDRAEVIRCDDVGVRCGDMDARCGDDRAELPAILAIAEFV